MTQTKYFYELTVRGGENGVQGAHACYMTRYTDDAGKLIAEVQGDAIPIALAQGDPGIPMVGVIGDITAQALVSIETKQAEISQLRSDLDAATQENALLLAKLNVSTQDQPDTSTGALAWVKSLFS